MSKAAQRRATQQAIRRKQQPKRPVDPVAEAKSADMKRWEKRAARGL